MSPNAPSHEVGFYGELDPFGGGISCSLADLPRLIRELSLFLLIKDVVILSPGNLLEHSLTLLACEALAPFVQAGRLTTTASSSVRRPITLIDDRARECIEGFGPSHRSVVDRARRSELSAIVDRWHALLPSSWSMTRDVPAQIAGFAAGILKFCGHEERPSSATTSLRHALEDSLGAGRPLARDAVLAQVAALRSSTHPTELARLALVVQSMFYTLGVRSHRECSLYPGAFAHFARQQGNTPAGMQLPPVDWGAQPARIEHRLRRLGVTLSGLLALPTRVLLSICESPQWRAVRGLLREPNPPTELEQAVATLFRHYADPTDALAGHRLAVASRRVPEFLLLIWQVSRADRLARVGQRVSAPGPIRPLRGPRVSARRGSWPRTRQAT